MDVRKTETRHFIKTVTVTAAWVLLSYIIASVSGTKGGGGPGGFGSAGLSLMVGWFFMAPCLFFALLAHGMIAVRNSQAHGQSNGFFYFLQILFATLFLIGGMIFFSLLS